MSITLSTHAAKDLGRESRRVDTTQTVAPQQGVAQVSSIKTANASASSQPAKPVSSVSAEDVKAAVEQMKDFAQVMSRQLQFDVDDDSGKTVVRVLDKDSGDIIRQIPSDEVLALAKHMRELMEAESAQVAGKGVRDQSVGLLVKTQA
ncbi:MAG: flagellar protein FlaG [Candidatus Thiodiazotropha sp.]